MAATYAGHNGSGVDTNPDNNVSFSTTRTIAAGEMVVVCVGINGGSLSDVSSASVGGLSLAKVVEGVESTQAQSEMWCAVAGSEIASGSTVSVTWGVNNNYKLAICLSLAGTVEVESSAGGSTTADSTPTTSAIASSDKSVTVATLVTNAGTITAGTGYTEIDQQTAGLTFDIQAQYNESPSVSEDADWTIGSAYSAAYTIASFAEAWPPDGEEDAPETLRVVATGLRY